MKKRIHLKKHWHIKMHDIIILIIISVICAMIFLFNLINKRFVPIMVDMAELEINKFSTIVVNRAISQVLEDKINADEIFSTVKSESGEIQTIDFNPIVVNQVLSIATTVVQNNLKLLENGDLQNAGIDRNTILGSEYDKLKKGIIAEIPLGAIFNNSVVSNIGPKIPIRLHYLGDVDSNITTKLTPYGINNALVEVGVHLKMTAQIVLPLITKKVILECNIPLAIKMIQGTVPSYYGSGLVKDSSIYSIPFE